VILSLDKWLESPEVKAFSRMPQAKASHEFFFRNPPRTMWIDHQLMASPADGVITCQGRYDPEADLIDVKGTDCTVNRLLGPWAIEGPAMVICIFMTAADVHWNRCPTAGLVSHRSVPGLRTMNLPMLFTERGLLDKGLIRKGTFGFMAANERVVNQFWVSSMIYTYYVVQIADSDVNCIVPMKIEKVASFNQNERFGQIIWGSMCCLILPLDPRYRFKPLAKVTDHVEATDAIIRIESHNSA
jgi:phosphatidylserine decarboxylase